MFINAFAVDQHLLKESLIHQRWYVHSKYKNSFNLQSKGKKELVVVTTTDCPFLPNGVYLEKNDFFNSLKSIKTGDSVLWEKERLAFSDHHLILTHGEKYSLEIGCFGEPVESATDYFFLYCKELKKETGVQLSLTDLIETENPFITAVDRLSSKSIEEQRLGVEFLLGRGQGLTPTGDDMLLGHLAARVLLKKDSKNVSMLLREKLESAIAPTTDVSRHYLLCGVAGRFSKPVKELINGLSEETGQEQIQSKIAAVTRFGHTSGIDLLAGFLGTLAYFRGK